MNMRLAWQSAALPEWRNAMHRRCLAIALSVLLPFGNACAADSYTGDDLVPDTATAVRLATVLLQQALGPKQFKPELAHASLRAESDGDAWIVSRVRDKAACPHRPPKPENGVETICTSFGGGHPVIRIAKHDARVESLTFTR